MPLEQLLQVAVDAELQQQRKGLARGVGSDRALRARRPPPVPLLLLATPQWARFWSECGRKGLAAAAGISLPSLPDVRFVQVVFVLAIDCLTPYCTIGGLHFSVLHIPDFN